MKSQTGTLLALENIIKTQDFKLYFLSTPGNHLNGIRRVLNDDILEFFKRSFGHVYYGSI